MNTTPFTPEEKEAIIREYLDPDAAFRARNARDRRARAEYMAMLAAIQDRDESEAGYTAEDWAAYVERTNDEAERRMQP